MQGNYIGNVVCFRCHKTIRVTMTLEEYFERVRNRETLQHRCPVCSRDSLLEFKNGKLVEKANERKTM